MEPPRRSDGGAPLLGGAPARQAPEAEEDSGQRSLLKALEAMVAASRRGLLGPAAMAAVEAMPDLDVEPPDGKAGREPPSAAPPAEEKKGEPEAGADKEGSPVVAVAPPLEGTGSQQPTPKEIWICGNSVISVSRTRANCSYPGLRLGFPPSAVYVHWRDVPTMMWDDVLPILHHAYRHRPFPSVIIIHAGESDLLIDDSWSFVTRMQSDLGILRRAFPDVVIIWSSLLPKHFWESPKMSQMMESERINVNCIMEKYCNESGVCYLSHPLIDASNKSLFLPDNTLSNTGNDIFLIDLKQALQTYLF